MCADIFKERKTKADEAVFNTDQVPLQNKLIYFGNSSCELG
jgi:hypothetical protein